MKDEKILVKNTETGHYEHISKYAYNKHVRKSNRITWIFYAFLLIIFIGIAYSIYTDLYRVYLIKKEAYVSIGNNYQIELIPKNDQYFDYKNYVYEVKNPSIATVTDYGEINPTSEGTTDVTIRFKNGIEKETLSLVVSDIEVQKLEVEKNISINKYDTKKIKVIVNGNENISTPLIYESSNTDILVVDDLGNVTGLEAGKAKLTISSHNGIVVETNITVNAVKEDIKDLSIKEKNIDLKVNNKKKLTLVISPKNASTEGVKWSSSDNKIVSVDNKGNIKGLKSGTAVISVTSSNGLESKCVINVYEDKVLRLNTNNVNITVGNTMTLTANMDVSWSSSDSSVVEVDNNGKVTAIKVGTAKVMASSNDGKSAIAEIKVNEAHIDVANIVLDKSSIDMNINDSVKLTYTITPSNATNKNVSWSTSNNKIVSVDQSGNIKALKSGSAKITIKSNNGKTSSVNVNVKKVNVDVQSISLNSKESKLKIGDSINLVATITPSNSTIKTVYWSSNDTSIATVDQNGKVSAKKVGTTIITAKSNNGKTATCKVIVSHIEPTSIKINETNVSLGVGLSKTLTVSYTPNNATNKSIIWSSSDTSIATVDSSGKVTGKKAGSVKITAYLNSNKNIKNEVTIKVNVVFVNVTAITIDKSKADVYVGSSVALTAILTPSNASDKTVTWSSSNTSVATVDSNGKVTGKKAGTATITAKSSSGKTSTCTITVKNKTTEVSKVTISSNVTTLYVGDNITLSVNVEPSNSSNKTVTWSSSNTSIATVDSNGKVTGKKAGSVKITATSKSNTKISNTKSIVVSNKPTAVNKITLNKTTDYIYVGSTDKLSVTFTPDYATDKTITWSSSDTKIAKVDSTGKITGVKSGSATITATSKNGKTAKCTVTIRNNTFSVPLKKSDGTFLYGADPFVAYDEQRGYYYYMATRGSGDVYMSVSENLQDIGNPIKNVLVYKNTSTAVVWAPEIHHFGDRWYVYLTWTNNPNDFKTRRVYAFRSKTSDPTGEWENMGKVYDKKHDFYAIDGTVFEWNKNYYFVYSGHETGGGGAQNLYIAHMSNPYTVDGERHLLAAPIWATDGSVNEGPEALIKNNKLHIVFSINGYKDPNYSLIMLDYKGGDILNKNNWVRNSNVLLTQGNGVYATGHASFTRSKDGKEEYVVYHAYESNSLDHRIVRIKKFTWQNDIPVIGKPESTDSKVKVPSGSTLTSKSVNYDNPPQWIKENGNWYYYLSNNKKATGWVKIFWNNNNSWFYFGTDGVMRSNKCETIDNKSYCFDTNGVCTTGC